MKEKILILKSEISKDYKRLNNLFDKFEKAYNSFSETNDYSKLVESAFYINQIYSGFERVFKSIARVFENNIGQDFWHKSLLERMNTDIEGIRPRVISEEAFKCLDELRAFRHFFRHAYDIDIDKDKFKIVAHKATLLKSFIEKDFHEFLGFLKELADELKD